MEGHRLGIKLFVADSPAVPLKEFVPVFHNWIQKQAVQDHLLVDVHDYSHIHEGPGILLVAHEGNFSMDMEDSRLGLIYYRKRSLNQPPHARVLKTLQYVLQGCQLLEDEPSLGGQLRFRTDELLVIANDRLNAPNNETTFSQCQPILSEALHRVFGSSNFKLAQIRGNSKER